MKSCKILFICHGNICRSPMAEFVMKDLVEKAGLSAQFDTVGRGFKAQMKYANKIGALYTVVLGENELSSGNVKLKNMADGTEEETTLKDFTDNFQSIVIRQAMAGFDTEGIDIKDILGGNA